MINRLHYLLTHILLLAVVLLLFTHSAIGYSDLSENRACLRCHAMATLAYHDPNSGQLVNLTIDPHILSHSVHNKLTCVKCHDGEFSRYPHQNDAQNKPLSCVNCHNNLENATERSYRFSTIETEFKKSVHLTQDDKPELAQFSCYSCHNPHRLQTSQSFESLSEIVQSDNTLCLSCHEKARPRHAWLPNREKHWQAVRCLDCHTPLTENEQPTSHEILAAEDSNRDCVNCHSKDSHLLNRLYQYRTETNLAQKGWINTAIFNDAYVIGMSRSPVLDRAALAIIFVTFLVLVAHGFGRYRAQQRAMRNHK